jgi:hypothetical protein
MKSQRLLYLLGFLGISLGYLVLSIWLQSRGFYNLESYFFEYKSQVLTRYDSGFLRTFYFTQPGFLFLISLPFSFFGKIQGIFVLNALLIGGLTNHLVFKSIKGKPIHKIFLVYLVLSPVILYAGTSGGSLAVYLVFYFLYFSLIMKYANSLSVFYLTLLSLLLGVHVLMDGTFVKLILIAAPIFYISGFYKAKGISGNFFYKSSIIFRNASQRRKFFAGFFASLFVLAFIPGMTYLIFLVINKVFAGDYFFYERSIGDSWNSYSALYPLTSETPFIWEVLSGSSVFYFVAVILIGVVPIFQLFQHGNSKSTRMGIGIILLFVISEVSTAKVLNLNLTMLSLLTGAGLASLFYGESTKSDLKLSARFIPFLIPFVAIFFEYTYFENSIVSSERLFLEVSHDANEKRKPKSLAPSTAIINQKGTGHILADDAIFYPELSQLGDKFTWDGHFSPQFLSALQQPELYADYLLVTTEKHPLHLNDMVAIALKRLESFDAAVDYQVLYEDELMQVLELKK